MNSGETVVFWGGRTHADFRKIGVVNSLLNVTRENVIKRHPQVARERMSYFDKQVRRHVPWAEFLTAWV